MTQAQIDDKIYETKMYIADQIHNIVLQAEYLKMKTAEDEIKVKQTLTKITDFAEEIVRGFGTLEELSREFADEETCDDNDSNGFFAY